MSSEQTKVAANILQYRVRAEILADDGHYDLAYDLRRIADELVFRYKEEIKKRGGGPLA